MAPTLITNSFQQRKLRSSSLATPKKTKKAESENTEPKTEIKKRTGRSRVPEAALRGVAQSPTKNGGSPIKKRSSSVATPLKPLQLNSPKVSSPLKSLQLNSPKKQTVAKKLVEEIENSPRRSLFSPDLTRLSDARKSLSTGLPDQVVGREKQTKILREFLEDNLTEKPAKKSKKCKLTKKSIYVSGPPGTGKTTTLKRLLDELPQDKKIRTVFLNCMKSGSRKIFDDVADALCPRKTHSNSDEAQKIVEEEVVKSKETILLVLDEVDQLDSTGQKVLYTLFELPYLANSKLVLVGIANSLDLTDRILPRLKIREAFCPAELTFPAYSKAEILAILKSRLSSFNENTDKPLFQASALEILARKISALSGDIRKALNVCEEALHNEYDRARKQTVLKPLEPGQTPEIKAIDVPKILKIVNRIYGSTVTSALRNGANDELPLQQKLLIASLSLLSSHDKSKKEITLGRLHQTYANVCKKRGMAFVDLSEAGSLCGLLESRGILAVKQGGLWAKSSKDRRVNLRIDEGEVEAALKDKTLLSGIINDISCIAK